MLPLALSVCVGTIYTILLKMFYLDHHETYFINSGDQIQKALVFLSMLFVNIFVHNREYDLSDQVGLEPIYIFSTKNII